MKLIFSSTPLLEYISNYHLRLIVTKKIIKYSISLYTSSIPKTVLFFVLKIDKKSNKPRQVLVIDKKKLCRDVV